MGKVGNGGMLNAFLLPSEQSCSFDLAEEAKMIEHAVIQRERLPLIKVRLRKNAAMATIYLLFNPNKRRGAVSMRGLVHEGCYCVLYIAVPFTPVFLVIEMNSSGERYDELAPENKSPSSASSTSTNNEAWVVIWLF